MSIYSYVIVKDIMVEPITVSKKAWLTEALKVMVKHNIGSLVVAEDHKALGILTERDITRIAASNSELPPKKVEDIMSKPVVTVAEDCTVWDAFRIMLKERIRRLPVEKDGMLTGIVSERDLFRWAMMTIHQKNVPDDIKEFIQLNVNPKI